MHQTSTTADILSGRMRATGALSIMSTVYTSTYLTANYTAAACKARARAFRGGCRCRCVSMHVVSLITFSVGPN